MAVRNKAECVAMSERARSAIQAGSIDQLRDMYADDAEFYVYFLDNAKRRWADVEGILGAITQTASGIAFRDVRVTPTENGFVQQHALVVTKKAGGEGVMHGVIIFQVNEAGKFTRMEEYGDASAIF